MRLTFVTRMLVVLLNGLHGRIKAFEVKIGLNIFPSLRRYGPKRPKETFA